MPEWEWIGRNQGPDATAGAWADYVYISPRSACCAEAIFLGAFAWPQSAAVAPGATYTQEAIVHIPRCRSATTTSSPG